MVGSSEGSAREIELDIEFTSKPGGTAETPRAPSGNPVVGMRRRRPSRLESSRTIYSPEAIVLITFQTDAYASITMFGDVAVTLIRLMGHSGAIPGALLAEDVPAALARLRKAVAANPDALLDPASPKPKGSNADEEPHVSLAHRALPLIELLQAAATQDKNVVWDKYG
jgi:hypothetical protein